MENAGLEKSRTKMLGRKMREEATATDNSARISGAYSAHEREQQDGESSTGSNAAYQAM